LANASYVAGSCMGVRMSPRATAPIPWEAPLMTTTGCESTAPILLHGVRYSTSSIRELPSVFGLT